MKLVSSLVLLAVALFGSADALKAPLSKVSLTRSSAVKAAGVAAAPALFSAAPVWAKDAALSASPYGTGGEGTSDTLGINDPSLLGVLVLVSSGIFAAYLANSAGLPDDDFFDGYDSTR
eukprot:CAMPEP_0119410830 /NCGR_PEP_ID=MMETSP1335-20130426/3741_1 /TAXON_ID=259385 /ORGANISM="Chrysoculter rhomboideus, Strain RCC1486" /LENGTH=118 /DNA_ID=CAMNT_0007435413 /DNA_START=13 /DNA_END=369 /DNA_ORIENTATION=-